jgi:hypothetical protein
LSDPLHIRKIIEEVMSGRVRIPDFQRGFVWDPERVAYLMDSIYKNYPFGSILFWRTKQTLSHERDLGPFTLPANDPSYPTDYILDGQQRVTSIFGVFQSEIQIPEPPLWTKIYFDLQATENAQDSSFMALDDGDADPERYFPIGCFFDPVRYRKQTSVYSDQMIERIDKVQARFKEALIPTQTIDTEDKAAVAIVFERVNRRGVELDTVQLLSAWTWSGDFDLNQRFEDLAAELAPFGFHDLGKDKDLLLRCCSAVLAKDPSPNALISLNGSHVRAGFEQVITGIKGAIDFLKKNLHIATLDNLPYDNLLVPLTVYFAGDADKQKKMDDNSRKRILHWFWTTCLGRRYNSQPVKNLKDDVAVFSMFKDGEADRITSDHIQLNPSYFTTATFRLNSVISKAYILMLAQHGPRSLISGAKIDLNQVLKDYNRHEFHHLYPKSYLKLSKQDAYGDSCLANICFLSRADNNTISGLAPSAYREKMPADVSAVAKANFLPHNFFENNYKKFVEERALLLRQYANDLLSENSFNN